MRPDGLQSEQRRRPSRPQFGQSHDLVTDVKEPLAKMVCHKSGIKSLEA